MGRYCTLEPLQEQRHADSLWRAWSASPDDSGWTYLWNERPTSPEACTALLSAFAANDDPLHFAVVAAATGEAVGTLALMRLDAAHGNVEVGHVNFTSPLISRSRMATEAVYLLTLAAFDAGFRRVEWKCDALNAPSVRAAARYGFVPEGVFRAHIVYKSRLRDTAWFALLREEWEGPRGRRAALEQWLNSTNFDEAGAQVKSLREISHALQQA